MAFGLSGQRQYATLQIIITSRMKFKLQLRHSMLYKVQLHVTFRYLNRLDTENFGNKQNYHYETRCSVYQRVEATIHLALHRHLDGVGSSAH